MKLTFSERVVEAAQSIPSGKVTTYGDLARACGSGGQAARSVNGILLRAHNGGNNNIPFHRIVYSNGQVWKDKKITTERALLYQKEGIEINKKGYIYDFEFKRYRF